MRRKTREKTGEILKSLDDLREFFCASRIKCAKSRTGIDSSSTPNDPLDLLTIGLTVQWFMSAATNSRC